MNTEDYPKPLTPLKVLALSFDKSAQDIYGACTNYLDLCTVNTRASFLLELLKQSVDIVHSNVFRKL